MVNPWEFNMVGISMKRIKSRRRIVNIKNCGDIEIINDFTGRVIDHWTHWLRYKGRPCRDWQIWKASDLVYNGFNKRYQYRKKIVRSGKKRKEQELKKLKNIT